MTFKNNIAVCIGFLAISILTFTLSKNYKTSGQDVADPSLILHYKFDKNPGAVAKDLGPLNNSGRIVNASWIKDNNSPNGALRFNSNSYIDCGSGDNLRVDGDMTLQLTLRLNQSSTKQETQTIFLGLDAFQLSLVNYGSSLIFYYRNRANKNEMMAVPLDKHILSDQWTNLAIVVEYPYIRIYQDDKLLNNVRMFFEGVSGKIQNKKIIGSDKPNSTIPMDLAEISFYRRALAANELGSQPSTTPASKLRAFAAAVIPTAGDISVDPDWYKNSLAVSVIGKTRDFDSKGLDLTVIKTDGSVVQGIKKGKFKDVSVNGSGRYNATSTMSLTKMDGQTIKVLATVAGTNIKIEKDFTLTKPAWIQNREGYSENVPAPWTAVTASSSANMVEVGVWGRKYNFGGTSLFKNIQTKGQDILAAPASLSCSVDGRDLTLNEGKVTLSKATDTRASVLQALQTERVSIKINSTTDFDGYITFDCDVAANRDLNLSDLKLDIPLKSDFATLCYATNVFPVKDKDPFSAWFSGALTSNQSFKFSPNLWIGNEDVGLCWQAESDEDWHNANPQKAIEILKGSNNTLFRLHFVDQPTLLHAGDKLHYKFALLATPVKPMVKDAWDWRIARSEPYGADLKLPDLKINNTPALQYYNKIGIRNLFINVSDNWPWPMPATQTFSDNLHKLVNATHGAGIKEHPYLIHQRMPVDLPEVKLYGAEMMLRPAKQYVSEANTPNSKRPGPISVDYGANSQAAFFDCPNSQQLQDAYIYSLAQRLNEYRDDGIYLDGTCHIVPCNNQAHGCGYKGTDGKLHETYPVFAVRQFMMRIYNVVKQHDPNSIVDTHCSWGYNPAGLAYSDVLWTGEQFGPRFNKKGVSDHYISGALSLEQFRTEFMGYQLGVGAEMLTYRLGDPIKCAAISLLHDVAPRLSINSSGVNNDPYYSLVPKIWAMRDQFDVRNAKKLYYWNNHDYVQLQQPNCYATLMQNPKSGVLMIISNLSKDSQTVSAQLNIKKLNILGAKLKAINPLTGANVNMTNDGKISVSLESEGWMYIWIKQGS